MLAALPPCCRFESKGLNTRGCPSPRGRICSPKIRYNSKFFLRIINLNKFNKLGRRHAFWAVQPQSNKKIYHILYELLRSRGVVLRPWWSEHFFMCLPYAHASIQFMRSSHYLKLMEFHCAYYPHVVGHGEVSVSSCSLWNSHIIC